MQDKKFYHIPEFARIMDLSRIEVFRKVKSGEIPARKSGKSYQISRDFADQIEGVLTGKNKKILDDVIKVYKSDEIVDFGLKNRPVPVHRFTKKISTDQIDYVLEKIGNDAKYNPAILQNCLNTPFLRGQRRELYDPLEEKAAIMFYLLIKNRPFYQQNAEFSILILRCFLGLNARVLNTTSQRMQKLADWIAQSDSEFYSAVMSSCVIFFKNHFD